MLNLLPIRLLLTVIIVLISVVVLAAVHAGMIGSGDAFGDFGSILRWSSPAALMLMLVPYLAWRWTPRVQEAVFPYLGGEWIGELRFHGPNGAGDREVSLVVNHSLLKTVMILDSDESTSRTLVVHAERDSGTERDRLYYVYLNERKEGVRGAGEQYRGLAVLRVEIAAGSTFLLGDYFTERQSTGTLKLTLQRHHPWWKFWK